MPTATSKVESVLVAENLRFDARLALFQEEAGWLAVADLHYGYEKSQQAAGALFPAWGMDEIELRLGSLLADYQPRTLLILGDLIHTGVAMEDFLRWMEKIQARVPEVILIRGNHDRRIRSLPLQDHWRIGSMVFHHGHLPLGLEEKQAGDVIFSGHLHPAFTLSDGAGFRQKLPVLCQTATGWVLPAFSPWAAGGRAEIDNILAQWASNRQKIWKIPQK